MLARIKSHFDYAVKEAQNGTWMKDNVLNTVGMVMDSVREAREEGAKHSLTGDIGVGAVGGTVMGSPQAGIAFGTAVHIARYAAGPAAAAILFAPIGATMAILGKGLGFAQNMYYGPGTTGQNTPPTP